jgi:Methyltransferase domain
MDRAVLLEPGRERGAGRRLPGRGETAQRAARPSRARDCTRRSAADDYDRPVSTPSGARRLVKQALARVGYSLVPNARYAVVSRDFNSPLPDLTRLDGDFWDTPRSMHGVDLAIEAAIELLTKRLAPYVREFERPADRPGYTFESGLYATVDAEVLYAMVRWLKPRVIVEFGSGASSHFIQMAAQRNAGDGQRLDHRIFDPYPFTASRLGPVSGPAVTPLRAEEVDPALVTELLGEGDVLFVDTTHTVKTGGDVDHIISAIIPRLAPGVWVHIHDVFLPYEYPREWVVDDRRLWAEQYLVRAFLAFNSAFRVRFPAMAVSRAAPETVAELVPGFSLAARPGAFWIERVGSP